MYGEVRDGTWLTVVTPFVEIPKGAVNTGTANPSYYAINSFREIIA
jgi:hypothetical protein